MQLYIQKDRARLSFKFQGNVKQLLDRLAINPETVIVTRNGALVAEDQTIDDKDKVEILQVVSGG